MALKKKADTMTSEEKESIQREEQRQIDEAASTQRMQLTTALVSRQFGLDGDYHVTKFNDKGKVIDISLENGEFRLAVTVKNSEAHGLSVD